MSIIFRNIKPCALAVSLACFAFGHANAADFIEGKYYQIVANGQSVVIDKPVDVKVENVKAVYQVTGANSTLTFTGPSFIVNHTVINNTNDTGWRRPTIEAVAGGTLNLGTEQNRIGLVNVSTTTSTDIAVGLLAWRKNGTAAHLNVHADTLKIVAKSTDYFAYGIYTYSSNDKLDSKLGTSTVTIDAANTIIDVSGKLGSRGVISWSGSELYLNKGNVFITAEHAINTRGNAIVQVNADGYKDHVVQLNGDVVFAYDPYESGTTTDADLTIRLMNDQSYLKGNIVELDDNDNLYEVENAKLEVSSGALWELDGDSFVNKLTLNNGRINVASTDATVDVGVLEGTGATIALSAVLNDDQTLTTGSVITDKVTGTPNLIVNVDGLTADDVVNGKTAVESLQGKIEANGATITNVIKEGDINGAISQIIDKNGTAGDVIEAVNQKLDGYSSIAALSAVQWRHENDTLLKRMGELRDAEGTVGAWARIYGSEQEYGDQSVKAKNSTIQAGSDYDVGEGWKVGGAFSYTNGSSSFDRGESDNKMYGLSLYGTYLADNGLFFDVIGKYARLSNDFTSGTMKGDFDNNAFSITTETGWHFAFNTLGFVEPSVGVTYGRIMGDDFVADNGVKVEQNDYDSLIGRVGVRSGFYFPEQKGNIYARIAVLHDFMSDMEAKASKVNETTGLNVSHLKEELGDTWIEYGIGANFSLAKNAYTFVDLEKTAGSDVKENWKWTIGARYMF